MASMDVGLRESILYLTGFCGGELSFRYLGISLASSKLKTSHYNMLLDAVAAKINAWPRASLSHAGKLELIRPVLQGVECFWQIGDICKLCRKFGSPTKHPPIAWNMLHKTREDGGWGLKDLAAWNKTLLAKSIWNTREKKIAYGLNG